MRRLMLATLTTGLVLLTAACGDETPAAGPAPSSSSASSPASSPGADPSEPAPESPTESPAEPTVTPATGPKLVGSISTINAPDDFRGKPLNLSFGGNVNGRDARYNVSLLDTESPRPVDSIDYEADLATTASIIQPPLVRQDDTTVGGLAAYHLSGEDTTAGRWAEAYGMRYMGHSISVVISTPLEMPQAERDALAAPVLASFTLLK